MQYFLELGEEVEVLRNDGENEEGEPWGRLQVDHYLLRTSPDSRLWLAIEEPGSVLFDRYSTLIEDIWYNHERYDIRTANISL